MAAHRMVPAKNATDDAGSFSDFVTKLLQVPHSEIKAQLDAEREAKQTSKTSSRVSGVPSKRS
jgi:hypothetical protein